MQKNGLPCLLIQIAGAVVFAVVITLITVSAADIFYGKPEQTGRGYTVDVAGTPAATTTTEGSMGEHSHDMGKPVDITPYLAKADLKLGAQIIKRCQACHNFEKDKPNSVGPNQYGLVGRKVASVAGFDYSDGMKKKGGAWTFQAISDFLTAPASVVPGTKMGFPGLTRPEDRAAVIMYINQTFSDKPLPVK